MEIHQLRYLVAVAELGNFTRAAERCFVTQPSLSQQIIKLEQELDTPLFDRTVRKVRLTEAGRRVYENAVEILAKLEAIQHDIHQPSDVGQVNIGAIPTIAPYLLPRLLRQFIKQYPKAQVNVFENLTEYTILACLEGEIDLGILALPIHEPQLLVEPLMTEELLLVMAAEHPLAKKKKIAMQDFSEEPFVLLSEAHCLGEQIVQFCKDQSCLPVVSCQSAQLLTVQELVAMNHGVSLIPQMAVDLDHAPQRQYRSLSGDKPTRTIALISRKKRHQTHLVQQFAQLIREETAAKK